ncbi:MAG TPA: RecX family transcriptional regulator [Candidatus Bathyarchaeia archaeon]|nr:RecX family transcriptional regulator [Candidatus Bathyarchaeia archaeon]
MAKVTRIKAQRNKKRVNIYLDGKFAFGLDVDNFLKAGLKVSQELTDKQVGSLVFENEYRKFLDRVYRLLSFRPRSEKEIGDYLARRKSPAEVAEKIGTQLKRSGYLDDWKFAHWWVDQRSTFRPRGKIALRAELRQKGVAKEIIEKAVEKLDELSLAKKAAKKKLKAYKKLDLQAFREKMIAFLNRRGFSWSTIKPIIDELLEKR